jgi:tetratricopeptide (TPR) repeat protein
MVLGRLGTGKGNLGLQLVCSPHDGRYRRRFFATLHFSNDVLSMIEAAADFFGAERGGDLLERLRRALMNDRHLLVIGGFERLLVPIAPRTRLQPGLEVDWTHPMPVGQPVTREAERLLEIVAEVAKDGKSHIVLTSSVEPTTVSDPVKMVRLQGIRFDSLRDHATFRALDDEQVIRDLHGTLRGHLYATSVAAHALQDLSPAEGRRWLEQLVVHLTPYDLPRRAALTVEAAVELLLSQHPKDARLLKGVLERVALFSTPVNSEAVLASCGDAEYSREDVERILDVLVHADLLMRVGYPSRERPMRYTAHTVVRTYVLHSLGNLPEAPSEPHRLSLSGFANESEEAQPISPAGHELAIRSFDALVGELERGEFSKPGVRRDLVRAAFGLMRSRWSVVGIGRHAHLKLEQAAGLPRTHYEAYERRLVRLLNAIRRAPETKLWLDERALNTAEVRGSEALLYADELAWLFNELTLVAFCQGAMPDAYSLARSTEDVGFVADYGTYGPRWCQAQINLALIHIDRARLQRARYHLDNAMRGAQRLGDQDMLFRIRGYTGLVCHLSGMYPDAEELYREAITGLQESGNRRGVSIFRRHRGDLLRKQERIDDARRDIQASIVAAEAGGHTDLVQYSRVAEANLRLAELDQRGQEVLLPAIQFARTVGLPKLEADTYKVQGHIALAHGETELAGRLAVSCLAIASAHGMRLRLTAGLVFMGRVARIRGDATAAGGLFRSAIELGQRQGYQMQVEEAERELMRMSSWEPAGRIMRDDVRASAARQPVRSDRHR